MSVSTISIKCGHCQGIHDSVAAVRQCSGLKVPTQRLPLAEVPAGRYAIVRLGKTEFFRVDRPSEGRWSGYTFVSQQAGDTDWPVRNRQSREDVLTVIGRDVKAAMLRYGMELGQCGECGRALTNEESRAAGIGPVCRAKHGW